MADLINKGLLVGTIDGITDVDVETTTVTTKLIDSLSATKTADKSVWVNGELTYTITLTNNSGEDFTDIVLTDTLDTTLIDLVPDSVYVKGVSTIYTFLLGVLTVNIGDLLNGETMQIIFKVARI